MDFKPGKIKEKVVGKKNDLKNSLKEMRRVLKITEKPDREEFSMSAKVTGAGMLLIGLIGFAFYLASNLIPQFL
ncbi:protein translocase SEC61 complex subunit gamma [Candidatus Nanosalina sp. VS9-1]|uniref:protein translocase SEC61 complex subunit gamma n=1 Tax=Candidatus Nanosalina sp. VS9-1 TaxID=3388566 RepID=UPI0039E0BA4A